MGDPYVGKSLYKGIHNIRKSLYTYRSRSELLGFAYKSFGIRIPIQISVAIVAVARLGMFGTNVRCKLCCGMLNQK